MSAGRKAGESPTPYLQEKPLGRMRVPECIVPSGVNGPVAIFLTTDPQPLAADVVVQNAAAILAGPALIFIDTEADALGALIRKGSNPVKTSDEITPDEAKDELSQASGAVSTETGATATESTDAAAAPTDAPTVVPQPDVSVIGTSTIPI
jgi:hypothetical protein